MCVAVRKEKNAYIYTYIVFLDTCVHVFRHIFTYIYIHNNFSAVQSIKT